MGEFRFIRPKGLEELLALKHELGGQGVLLAGGSNVMVYIEEGSIRGGTLLDLSTLRELKGVSRSNGTMAIGAAETMADLLASPEIQRTFPVLTEMLAGFANPLVRNRATLGGNLGDASPIGDAIPPLLVLGASVRLLRHGGERVVPLEEFFTGPGKQVLAPEEVIHQVLLPAPAPGQGAFVKLGLRHGTSCSVTSVAVRLEPEGGKVGTLRIACGGVAPTPRRALNAERALSGQPLEEGVFQKLAAEIQKDISPISDVRGSAEYRREVTVQLLIKALRRAAGIKE